jgi:hypothetical protein
MSQQRYSKKEALNRIVRSWLGLYMSSDKPDTLTGSILSEDEAFSFLAELFEDSLPGETPQIPDAVKASVAEAEAGTNDTKAVTPLGLQGAIDAIVGANIEYGEIYNNSTGTAVVALSTSWTKVTGSFQGDTVSSADIIPDSGDDRITINLAGVYFVGIQASFSGTANAVIEGAAYLGGLRQEPIRFRRKLGGTGDVGSASAIGVLNVTGTVVDLEFYARSDSGTPSFKLESGQLWVYGLPIT